MLLEAMAEMYCQSQLLLVAREAPRIVHVAQGALERPRNLYSVGELQRMWLSEFFLQNKKVDYARKTIDALLNEHPDNEYARKISGMIYLENRETKKGIAELENAGICGSLILAKYYESIRIYRDENRKKAIKALENALEKCGEGKSPINYELSIIYKGRKIYHIYLDAHSAANALLLKLMTLQSGEIDNVPEEFDRLFPEEYTLIPRGELFRKFLMRGGLNICIFSQDPRKKRPILGKKEPIGWLM